MIPPEFQKEVDAFPELLRRLLDAELAAGNRIVSVRHTFPAPPAGAALMMAAPITTRERASGDGFVFRERSSSLYDGTFTDSRGFFYLLEPPLPPPPEPDMDAIREAANPRPINAQPRTVHATNANVTAARALPGSGSALVDEFRKSMKMDFDKWHDGTGYDLDLIARATPAELVHIERLLVPPSGWRDVEALACLDTDSARTALAKALKAGHPEVRTAVARYAPTIGTPPERANTLLRALRHGQFFDDLSSALDQVEEFHPPEIVDELFRGLLVRPGEIACNFAGMLAFIHGKGDSSFDWSHRPLFLRFNSDDGAERQRAFVDLCVLLELDADDVLKRIGKLSS